MKKRIIVAKEDAEAIVAAINAGELKGARATAAREVFEGEAGASSAESPPPPRKGLSRTLRYRALLVAACLFLVVSGYVLLSFGFKNWKATQFEKNLDEFLLQVARTDQVLKQIEEKPESRALQDQASMERKELARLKENIDLDARARIEAIRLGDIENAHDLAVGIDALCNRYLEARSKRLTDLLAHYKALRTVYAVGNPQPWDVMRKLDLEEEQAKSLCRDLESLTPLLKRFSDR